MAGMAVGIAAVGTVATMVVMAAMAGTGDRIAAVDTAATIAAAAAAAGIMV
jgi:hypothetical protein